MFTLENKMIKSFNFSLKFFYEKSKKINVKVIFQVLGKTYCFLWFIHEFKKSKYTNIKHSVITLYININICVVGFIEYK